MLINITINGKLSTIDCNGDETLLHILRKNNLVSVKCGCSDSSCGACTVLVNNKPILSCLVPIGAVHNQIIVTLEYFSTTKEYEDVILGLQNADVNLCGFCNASKVFAINEIINTEVTPTRSDIHRQLSPFTCMCTNIEKIFDSVYKAFDIRYERTWKETYAKK